MEPTNDLQADTLNTLSKRDNNDTREREFLAALRRVIQNEIDKMQIIGVGSVIVTKISAGKFELEAL